ncbi:MAG: hypothetical protein DMF80_20110 [Acidobacteria bacterium]|nr:MAG: hypothetical protein DMF80_20110 [Acidobacteriota bacterium]
MQVKTAMVTFGVMFLTAAFVFSNVPLLTHLWELRQSAVTTTGTVVAVDANNHNIATYRYRVGAVDYMGSESASRHKEGESVMVYYAPAHPWVSVLTDPAGTFRDSVAGTVFISTLIVLLGAFAALRAR